LGIFDVSAARRFWRRIGDKVTVNPTGSRRADPDLSVGLREIEALGVGCRVSLEVTMEGVSQVLQFSRVACRGCGSFHIAAYLVAGRCYSCDVDRLGLDGVERYRPSRPRRHPAPVR
jgi:hypothetical protein